MTRSIIFCFLDGLLNENDQHREEEIFSVLTEIVDGALQSYKVFPSSSRNYQCLVKQNSLVCLNAA